jgi:hypothetical protein
MQNQTPTQTQIQTQIQTNATTVQTHDGDDWWMSDDDDDDDMYDLIDFGIASNGGRLSMQRG